jgi:uncharacterized protein YkvS
MHCGCKFVNDSPVASTALLETNSKNINLSPTLAVNTVEQTTMASIGEMLKMNNQVMNQIEKLLENSINLNNNFANNAQPLVQQLPAVNTNTNNNGAYLQGYQQNNMQQQIVNSQPLMQNQQQIANSQPFIQNQQANQQQNNYQQAYAMQQDNKIQYNLPQQLSNTVLLANQPTAFPNNQIGFLNNNMPAQRLNNVPISNLYY